MQSQTRYSITKKILAASTLLITAVLFIFFYKASDSFKRDLGCALKEAPHIAITQIVEHSSLDMEREGIESALHDNNFEDGYTLNQSYQNAQGSISTAAQIASTFVGKKPDVIVAISTPSAQSLSRLCLKHKIPCVFTAVSDPDAARVVNAFMMGVSDFLPVRPQVTFMKILMPDLTHIGIIYNSGEANSVLQVERWKAVIDEINVILVREGVPKMVLSIQAISKTSDVATAAQALVAKGVQAFMIPNDNTVVSAIGAVVNVAHPRQIPVFAGDVGSVKQGAVACLGYDRYKLGYKAGEMVVRILKKLHQERQAEKRTPSSVPFLLSDMPVLREHDFETFINMKAAEQVGLAIPDPIKSTAKIV